MSLFGSVFKNILRNPLNILSNNSAPAGIFFVRTIIAFRRGCSFLEEEGQVLEPANVDRAFKAMDAKL